jgi:processive 1,2-diacylglycerol beta-glucosyltransferase
MNPRILVLSASVGAGHMRAAEAVEAAARQIAPEATVENHDVLNFTNALFRRLYGQAYLDLVNRLPHVVGYFYDRMDQPSTSGRNRTDRLRLAVEKLNLKKFEKLLTGRPWDLVINTHFLPAELIATLRREGRFTAPQVTVCTDFDTHRLWVNQPCDRYFCATPEGREYLRYWGVPAAEIEVTGIPIMPAFAQPVDRPALLARHGLTGDRPVILQLCGGFGVGPVEEIFRGLLALEKPIELVAVCGRNEELCTRLGQIAAPERHRVKVIGFTRQIDELMGVADLIVSKPGGLTTSEALARGVPMAIVNPIPGQESRNSDYLLEHGAGIKINHPALIELKLSQLLADAPRMNRMREAARSLGHPQAAFDVVRSSLELIQPTANTAA